jgi:hypothetical protein
VSLSTVRPTHSKVRELGQEATDRIIEADFTLLHEDHRRYRGDRLGHRRESEHVVLAKGCGAPSFANANAAGVRWAAILKDQHRNARSAAAFDKPPQRLIELCRAGLWRKASAAGAA